MTGMNNESSWDFRDNQELASSHTYNKEGYIIEKADLQYLELIKHDIERSFHEFANIAGKEVKELENAHLSISNEKSNDLRLHIMKNLYQNTRFHRNYYNAAKNIIHSLCGNELAMQKRPGLSINLPQNKNDVLPIHADTWNGVSPFELNIWIPLVNCRDSMCLYILKRDSYKCRLNETKELLRLTSDELFNELRDDLTWIPIEYGEILAFDQSLLHGLFQTKSETHTGQLIADLKDYILHTGIKN